ncbi:MAG: glycosyltransferase family 4 protein [Desulfuromonadales bacterium]
MDPTKRAVCWEHQEFDEIPDTRLRKFSRLLRGVFLNAPISADHYHSRDRLGLIIHKLVSYHPDIVILGNSHLGFFEPIVRKYAPDAAIVLDTHNVEWLAYKRLAETASTRLQVIKNMILSRCTQQLEKRVSLSCDEVWTVSDNDAHAFASFGAERIHVIPNTIPLEQYQPLPLSGNRTISFIGLYDYSPNEQAALFMIACSHRLKRKGVEHTLILIGANPTPKMYADAGNADHIRITGEVPSARDEILKADILAAPIIAGGGTKFKIIEAFALGRAVVTTPLGSEGLTLRHGRDALICPLDQFDANVASVLESLPLAQHLGKHGRAWVEANLSPAKIQYRIIERIETIANQLRMH